MLIDGEASRSVVSRLKAEAFYNEKNRKVFQAMQELFRNAEPIDLITVGDRMVKNGAREDEVLPYLTKLAVLLPSGANYLHYAKILTRDLTLRNVITKCNEIIEKAYEASDADEVVYFAEKLIYELSKDMSKNELIPIHEATTEVIERIQLLQKDKNAMRGLYTGFRIFDKVTNGLQNGDLIIQYTRWKCPQGKSRRG